MGIRSFFVAAVLVLGVCFSSAFASENSQEKLINLYAQYKGAMTHKNYAQAFVKARDAWEYAEEAYGDSKTTGDFAYNYAALGSALKDTKSRKRIIKAFERAQDLARFHSDEQGENIKIELERRRAFADYLIIAKIPKKAEAQLKQVALDAEKHGMKETLVYADIILASTRLAYNRKKFDAALDHAQTAYDTYKKAGGEDTKDAYEALFYRSKLQEKRGEYGPAYLGYEKIFVNADGVLKKGNQLVGRAYLRSYVMSSNYFKDNNGQYLADTIERACPGCWPNFDPKYKPLMGKSGEFDFERYPPKMPKSARSSAMAAVKYDTDENGKPINIELIYRSHSRTFDQPIIDGIARWTVYEKGTKTPAANRKDLITKSTFILRDFGGEMIDFYGIRMD